MRTTRESLAERRHEPPSRLAASIAASPAGAICPSASSCSMRRAACRRRTRRSRSFPRRHPAACRYGRPQRSPCYRSDRSTAPPARRLGRRAETVGMTLSCGSRATPTATRRDLRSSQRLHARGPSPKPPSPIPVRQRRYQRPDPWRCGSRATGASLRRSCEAWSAGNAAFRDWMGNLGSVAGCGFACFGPVEGKRRRRGRFRGAQAARCSREPLGSRHPGRAGERSECQ